MYKDFDEDECTLKVQFAEEMVAVACDSVRVRGTYYTVTGEWSDVAVYDLEKRTWHTVARSHPYYVSLLECIIERNGEWLNDADAQERDADDQAYWDAADMARRDGVSGPHRPFFY